MQNDIYLRVFREKSELVLPDGSTEIFLEGAMDTAAIHRLKRIVYAFSQGYLEKRITTLKESANEAQLVTLSEQEVYLLERLINAMTSEVGRALIGLTIMQLCIKAIEPQQSVRLHKGSNSSRDFSWRGGISMRSLDKRFITPALRKFDLLKLNADGFMMTRSLAENYPYSFIYKANIRGAKAEWIQIVEGVETGIIQPEIALDYVLSKLINQAETFKALADDTLALLDTIVSYEDKIDKNIILDLMSVHIATSNYAARIMEISMHSLMQSIIESGSLGTADLKPLSQMRSANKKHGNIGDIEIIENEDIVESWDAKYGKTYLRDEIEELVDKLAIHPHVMTVGFVTSGKPERVEELSVRFEQIEMMYGVYPRILTFGMWVDYQFNRVTQNGLLHESEIAKNWLRAYTESIAQKRRDVAPIDEPCYEWLNELKLIFGTVIQDLTI